MRFRKIRKIGRWNAGRVVGIISVCFVLGLMVGLQYSVLPETKKLQVVASSTDPRVAEWMKNGENLEILGRKKLSVMAERPTTYFTRLPASFERNIYPPKPPSRGFTLEPTLVIARNRNEDASHDPYFMLFIVKSAPIHFSRRDIIRRTWGAVKVVNGRSFNTIFVIGSLGEDGALQRRIEHESRENGDILQAQVPEGYRKLPIKVLSAMQWLVSKSNELSSDFYTFTDDDCVIHISNAFDFFSHLRFIDDDADRSAADRAPATSIAPPGVKKIQDIELYKKMKVNEVTLPSGSIEKANFSNLALEAAGNLPENLDRQMMRSSIYAGEETVNDLPELDPNARIQIERTGREDEIDTYQDKNNYRGSSWKAVYNITPVAKMKETYNTAYRANAQNLSSYLKISLKDVENPGEIFKKRRLEPDGLYCGFSYDPHQRPHRNLKTKWGVSMEEYSEENYPAFCHGGMYTMTGAKMTAIFAVSTVTDYSSFHLEDVLVTGILREKSGVTDSKFISGSPDPKSRPLMYYVWDSGPRVMFKMSRKWRYFTRQLLGKRFVMEAMRNGKLVTWKNYDDNEA